MTNSWLIDCGDILQLELKSYGQGVKLHPLCKIPRPELVEIGDHSRICDFVFIWPGKGVKIGKYCDLQPGAKVWGGGTLEMGNYVSVGPNAVLLTAVYDYKTSLHMVDFVPEDERHALYGKLVIGDDVYIGANATIMPCTIGVGAVIGAGAVVTKDVEPWSIMAGVPARKIGERPQLIKTKHVIEEDGQGIYLHSYFGEW